MKRRRDVKGKEQRLLLDISAVPKILPPIFDEALSFSRSKSAFSFLHFLWLKAVGEVEREGKLLRNQKFKSCFPWKTDPKIAATTGNSKELREDGFRFPTSKIKRNVKTSFVWKLGLGLCSLIQSWSESFSLMTVWKERLALNGIGPLSFSLKRVPCEREGRSEKAI